MSVEIEFITIAGLQPLIDDLEASVAPAADAAVSSAASALASKNAAQTSATNAGNSANAASSSKDSAQASATNAGNSATSALASKDAAQTSATNAGNSASAANASAANAAAAALNRIVTVASMSTTYNLDLSLADNTELFVDALAANTTMAFTGAVRGKTVLLWVVQGGAGNFTITFQTGAKLPGGSTVIDWNLTAGGATLITLVFRSATEYALTYVKL